MRISRAGRLLAAAPTLPFSATIPGAIPAPRLSYDRSFIAFLLIQRFTGNELQNACQKTKNNTNSLK
jgi:hypothetical protein